MTRRKNPFPTGRGFLKHLFAFRAGIWYNSGDSNQSGLMMEVIVMKMTPMQRKIYEYLWNYQREHGYIPAIRDICAAMNLKSSSTAHFHLKNLENAGALTIEPGKSRAITLLHNPEADAENGQTSGADPEGDRTGVQRGIPVLGTVAAGTPILAQECIEEYLTLDVPAHGGKYFALRVRGESMLNAGIFPGDYVIVRQQPEANHGEIVVALIGDEATVKRYCLRGGRVWLLPENDAYSPIDGANALILGIVTAVWRTYERM